MRQTVEICAAALLLAGSAVTRAQQQAPAATCHLVQDANGNWVADPKCPVAPAPSTAPSTPSPPTAPAAKRFPFPGEETAPVPAPSAAGTGAPASVPAAPAPAQGQTATPGAPAVKRFPYPGEPAEAPAAAPADGAGAGQSPLKDAGSSGESSSSSSSSSADSGDASGSTSSATRGGAAKDAGDDPDDTPAPRRTRRKLPPVPRQSPSEREAEDVQVAGYYQNDGNFKGAYERAKEAVSLDTTDPSAHLALAESARKLGKLDEAEQEYKQCLTLDPVPKERKVAEKALKEMTGGGA